jgi:hypothetical protein
MTGRPFACQGVAACVHAEHVTGMAEKDKAEDREREERLAAALRENLRRRKAQARELSQPAKDKDQS